jgi:hypothetical protein
MKRKYEVEWYELNLTKRKSRKFFTEPAALLFAWWIEYTQDINTRILRHG